MKLLLQSQIKFELMAYFIDNTRHLELWSRKECPDRLVSPINGHFSLLDGNTIAFFRNVEGSLCILIDQTIIVVTDNFEVDYFRDDQCHLIIFERGEELFHLNYSIPLIIPPLIEDFVSSFVEEEDFDIGLFIFNVLKDSKRKEIIYQGKSDVGSTGAG
jgi:hypothetical protein